MKHNDLQLQELLRLARSCLKYDRLPGELSERKFFDKFDAERQSEMELADQSLETSGTASTEDLQVGPILELSPPLEAPGEDPPDVRTLRRQTSQLERTVAEARQALEAATAELSQEVLKRSKFEKEEKAVESDYNRVHRQFRLAKEMVKRQNGEIKQLHATITEFKATAWAAARPSPPPTLPQPPAAPKGGRSRPAGRAVKDAGASQTPPGDGMAQPPRVPPPPPPPLAATFILPPKSRTFESVLLSRPKDDAWKMFIP